METFHILHLAASWSNYHGSTSHNDAPVNEHQVQNTPVFHGPTNIASNNQNQPSVPVPSIPITQSRIRAASVQMVFASRTSQDFIAPDMVVQIQDWTGKAALEALYQLGSDIDVRGWLCLQFQSLVLNRNLLVRMLYFLKVLYGELDKSSENRPTQTEVAQPNRSTYSVI